MDSNKSKKLNLFWEDFKAISRKSFVTLTISLIGLFLLRTILWFYCDKEKMYLFVITEDELPRDGIKASIRNKSKKMDDEYIRFTKRENLNDTKDNSPILDFEITDGWSVERLLKYFDFNKLSYTIPLTKWIGHEKRYHLLS